MTKVKCFRIVNKSTGEVVFETSFLTSLHQKLMEEGMGDEILGTEMIGEGGEKIRFEERIHVKVSAQILLGGQREVMYYFDDDGHLVIDPIKEQGV